MAESVLITGGAGYLGSILSEHLLERGFRVTVLDNLSFGEQSLFHLCADPRFEFVYGDVRDEALVGRLSAEAEILVPLAAIVGAPACDRDPAQAQSVNLDAIRLLLRCRSPKQLVVYPTTNSGYGTKSGLDYCTEETPLEPISLYGRTKVQAETAVLESPNTITLRLATVFGMSPRMRLDLLVNYFVHEAVTRRAIVLFEKDFKRNYVHIRDVADCFLHSIAHADRMVGRPYNVGLDSANLSKEELAQKIRRHVRDLAILVAEMGRDPDQRNYIVSSQRLCDAGFVARRSLDEGIHELIKGYRMLGRGRFTNV
jgi:nucleoside-diphosphate-sugar epimerase